MNENEVTDPELTDGEATETETGLTPEKKLDAKPQNQKTDIASLPVDVQDYIKALRTEASEHRKAVQGKEKADQEAAQSKLLEEKKYTEVIANLKREKDKLDAELATLKRETLVSTLASSPDYNLPKEIWENIKGNTEEEIKAECAKFAKVLKTPKSPSLETGSAPGKKPVSQAPGVTAGGGQNYIFQDRNEIPWA